MNGAPSNLSFKSALPLNFRGVFNNKKEASRGGAMWASIKGTRGEDIYINGKQQKQWSQTIFEPAKSRLRQQLTNQFYKKYSGKA